MAGPWSFESMIVGRMWKGGLSIYHTVLQRRSVSSRRALHRFDWKFWIDEQTGRMIRLSRHGSVIGLAFLCCLFGIVCVSRRDTSSGNLLLISIDTLRPDHLRCYGYDRETSPTVDALATDGVLFRTAIAQAPSTLPSHASILTGLIPSHHGAFHHARARLPDHITTLAEILKKEGFATAAFHGGGQVSEIYGLSQGFDRYEFVENERFSKVVDHGIQWLEPATPGRFFLFLHTYETHVPYQAKEYLKRFETDYQGSLPDLIPLAVFDEINFQGKQLSGVDSLHIINAYDAAVYSMDISLSRLIGYLKKRNIYDNTLIVFTSDHGEEFGEHGKVGYHTHTVYDELLKVPLLIKFPDSGYAGTRIDTQVRSIDITPTILQALGIAATQDVDGSSLFPLLLGEGVADATCETSAELQFAVSERDDAADSHHVMSIRTNESKLYVIKKYDTIARKLFFDLKDDPGEQENILPRRQRRADSLWKQFQTIKSQRECPPLQPISLDEQTSKRLRELGYTD